MRNLLFWAGLAGWALGTIALNEAIAALLLYANHLPITLASMTGDGAAMLLGPTFLITVGPLFWALNKLER